MKEEDVRRLVRQQVESIRKAESGVLPPTPYVVCEILVRMKTMKPWEGMATTEPIGRALRVLVEEAVHGRKFPPSDPQTEPETEDLSVLSPIEVVKKVKAKKHRHLQDPPLRKTG